MTETQSLGFSEALNASTKKIFQFSGRARRSEYWWTMLVFYAVGLVVPVLGWIAGLFAIPLTFRRLHDTGRSGWWWGAGAIIKGSLIVCFLYETFSIMVLHENTMSATPEKLIAKYLLWALLVLAWKVVLLIFLCTDSDVYENDYGESTKYIEENQDCA